MRPLCALFINSYEIEYFTLIGNICMDLNECIYAFAIYLYDYKNPLIQNKRVDITFLRFFFFDTVWFCVVHWVRVCISFLCFCILWFVIALKKKNNKEAFGRPWARGLCALFRLQAHAIISNEWMNEFDFLWPNRISYSSFLFHFTRFWYKTLMHLCVFIYEKVIERTFKQKYNVGNSFCSNKT